MLVASGVTLESLLAQAMDHKHQSINPKQHFSKLPSEVIVVTVFAIEFVIVCVTGFVIVFVICSWSFSCKCS